MSPLRGRAPRPRTELAALMQHKRRHLVHLQGVRTGLKAGSEVDIRHAQPPSRSRQHTSSEGGNYRASVALSRASRKMMARESSRSKESRKVPAKADPDKDVSPFSSQQLRLR
ncbi:hypothetical protein GN956_G9381 [Arapaima gigas]